MPQLDVTTFLPQIVWLVITFLATFLIMWRVAVPKISDVLEARQKKIADNLERAGELKKEAEAAIEAYEKALAEARASAHEEIAKVQSQLADKAAKEEAKLSKKLSDKIAESEASIQAAMDEALSNLDAMSAEVAGAAVERLTGEAPDQAAVGKAVAAAAKARA